MADTTFVNNSLPAIDAGWLNDTNNLVYNLVGDGTNPPTNRSDVRNNLGLGNTVGAVPVLNGGTGATTAAAARTNLGVPQIGPVFSAVLTSNQALTSGAAAVVLYQNEDFDTDNYYDPSTGRYTPLVAGYYQVNFSVLFDAAGNVFTTAHGAITKNAVEWIRGTQVVVAAGAAMSFLNSTGSAVLFFNGTTDFVDIRVVGTTTAGNPRLLATGSRFSAHFIRP